MYGLLTKCEVKMAGYWPSSFFACLWTSTSSRSINSQKKNEANIQPSWLNKLGQERIYYMAFRAFYLRDTAGSPERARWLHLARSGSQSQCAIWFILPACGASHIIIWGYCCFARTTLQVLQKQNWHLSKIMIITNTKVINRDTQDITNYKFISFTFGGEKTETN